MHPSLSRLEEISPAKKKKTCKRKPRRCFSKTGLQPWSERHRYKLQPQVCIKCSWPGTRHGKVKASSVSTRTPTAPQDAVSVYRQLVIESCFLLTAVLCSGISVVTVCTVPICAYCIYRRATPRHCFSFSSLTVWNILSNWSVWGNSVHICSQRQSSLPLLLFFVYESASYIQTCRSHSFRLRYACLSCTRLNVTFHYNGMLRLPTATIG